MSFNPLAIERFRTILIDAIKAASDGVGRNGEWHFPEPESLAAGMLPDLLVEAHFEYQTNGAGVAMRRVVIASDWEIDPGITQGG